YVISGICSCFTTHVAASGSGGEFPVAGDAGDAPPNTGGRTDECGYRQGEQDDGSGGSAPDESSSSDFGESS
ncbi:unnamed protein product, partial [Amoebophrya sp. A25]